MAAQAWARKLAGRTRGPDRRPPSRDDEITGGTMPGSLMACWQPRGGRTGAYLADLVAGYAGRAHSEPRRVGDRRLGGRMLLATQRNQSSSGVTREYPPYCRTAFSVALAIFWRMHSEAQLLGTVAPGHDEYERGLRDRPPTRAVRTLRQL